MNGGSEGEKAALKALRVIHVVRSDGFAGVERYISTVAPELARRGLRVEVIGGNAARMNLALAPAGVTHRSAATSPGVARALARSGRADILHAHMTAAELVSIAMAPLLRARVVSTRHFAHRRGVPRIVDRAMARGLAAQIGISEFAAQVCGGVTVVIPNAVENVTAVHGEGRQAMVAQRLEKEKRTEDALLGWAASGLGSSGWQLVIAGDGADRRDLERRVVTLGLVGSVRFLGLQDDVGTLRARSAFQIATQPDDGFGLSVAEAMAAGLPVLAARGGGHSELLAELPELLYPAGDAAALGDALRRMAARKDRGKLGLRLQQVQRARYSIEGHVDALVALYRQVAP